MRYRLVRRTSFVGPLLAIFIALMHPPYSQKVRVEGASLANPTLVGKADVPRLSPVLNPTAASKSSTGPIADLHPLDFPPVPPPRTEIVRKTQSRPKAVLELIHYPWQQLGYEVVFLSARPGFRAMTISDKRKIEVYMRSGDQPLDTAYDVAHEFGHAFDLEYNDAERRGRWCVMRGIDPDTPWFGCNRCPDYSTPAGDFAETFAFLLLGPGNYHSRMAAPPKQEEIRQLAAFCHIDLEGLWYTERLKQATQQGRERPEPPTDKTSQTAGTPRDR
jgi:hypothetical protein